MSVADQTLKTTFAPVVRTNKSDDEAVPYRRQIYLVCVGLALACNYILGKDMAWDTLNYHYYLGFSALNDRFGQDYFAAGMLGYLNPYAYIPFYSMVQAGLPALAICSVFAAVHSVILCLSFELGLLVCPSPVCRTRMLAGICSVGLAFMNPILMQQIGSCFADITTAELALGGWLMLAFAVQRPRVSLLIFAGLILGAASAFKLSNALSAVSAFTMLALLPLGWRAKSRYAFSYCASLGVGFAIVAAPWSYRLERIFGNPMFPMFNNFFRSPEFTTESAGSAYRFIPESIGEALWRPFAMLDPYQMVHEELSAPDSRYAILVALGLILAFRCVWRRFSAPSLVRASSPLRESTRVLAALACGLVVYWILWLRASGNSRYVLTMACVASAVIVGILFQQLKSRPKARNYILVIIFVSQSVQLYMGAEYRWNGVPWGGEWFDVSIPEKLKTEPNLYLTLGSQSNSFLAPFFAHGSGFINVAGGYTLDPNSANGDRVRALIRRFSPHIRVIFQLTRPLDEYKDYAFLDQVDGAITWFGLRAARQECSTIAVHGLPPELEIRYDTTVPQAPQDRETTYIGSCLLVPDTIDRSALVARQRAVNVVMDRMEDACPKLFQPRRPLTVNSGDVWRRIYGATDIVAWVSHGRLRFSDQIRPHGVIDLGSENDWAKSPLRLDCGRRGGVDYAHALSNPDESDISADK